MACVWTSGYVERYNIMQVKPMEVISHLYYRLCVATGGPKARVPG